ncbi:hypothetical protein ACFQZ4_00255 [Catellatospora coxensis]
MGAPNRWLMLGLGMLAQGACYLPTGALILLVPALRAQGTGSATWGCCWARRARAWCWR